MRKFILALLLSIAVSCPAMAQVVVGNATLGNTTIKNGTNVESATLTALKNIGGLTFYKDFTNGTVDAEFSAGSKTGTYLSTRSATAPSGYFSWDGTNCVYNKVTTSDVALFDECYYDDTGAHQADLGYHAYREMKNELTYSNTFDDVSWSTTSMDVAVDGTAPGGAGTAYSITATADDGNIRKTIVGNSTTLKTASVFIKRKTGTGKVYIKANNVDGYTDITSSVSSSFWTRVYTTSSSSNAYKAFYISLEKSGDSVYIAYAQLEVNPYATPYIPTTTAALTRAGDVLKYENLLNSTANEETIFVKFTPGSTFANDGITRRIYDIGTKNRQIYKSATTLTDRITFRPNSVDSASLSPVSTTVPLISETIVSAFVAKHSTPYAIIYVNGLSEGTDSSPDFINNLFGTYFYLGSTDLGASQADVNIQSVTKFNRALSSTEVAQVTALLQ